MPEIQIIVVAMSFLVGLLIGIFIPFICVQLYRSIGFSLGEMFSEEDED